MADILKFILENFRGVERTEISLSSRINTPIVTLVGLNESGKTTILEALSHFVTGDPIIAKIFEESGTSSEALSLVPIHKKANFSGIIKFSAEIILDDKDIVALSRLADSKFKLDIDTEIIKDPFIITKQFSFLDGNLDAKNTGNRWAFKLQVKTKRARNFKDYKIPTEGDSLVGEIWKLLIRRLPSISYFPTFLVDLPPRIYLSEHPEEKPTNRHYRSVLQDVLDSLDEGLKLETHVAQRIIKY